MNKINKQTILFAIGSTTADEIKKYSDNKIIISKESVKEILAGDTMIAQIILKPMPIIDPLTIHHSPK